MLLRWAFFIAFLCALADFFIAFCCRFWYFRMSFCAFLAAFR